MAGPFPGSVQLPRDRTYEEEAIIAVLLTEGRLYRSVFAVANNIEAEGGKQN